MANDITFTKDELQEALHDAIVEKLEEKGFDFNNTDISNENSFNQELDKVADSIIENASDNGEIKEVGNDEFKLDKDISEWANEQAAQEFANDSLDKAIEEGYSDKYDISDNVKDMDNWTEAIKEFENSSENNISNSAEDPRYNSEFDIGEKLVMESDLYNDSNSAIMTREEGIEKALEAGVDIQELVELTSEKEVLQAATNSSEFEVLNAYELQSSAEAKVVELLMEDAKEYGLEINTDNLNAVVADVINQDYVSGDSGIADTVNNLDTDNNATALNNSSNEPEVILNTENMSREELVEAIAASLYEDNKEAIQEKVNNGETFELSQFDKSESNLNSAIESFGSKAENAELSKDNEGQKNADSAKQK